ncbi:Uncharacterised protein [Mycobacteroides abscessus subsp. massiliense]|nr:Uncharacterised protein [Mycobacteroides abscessus subsp. massiliense]SKK89210.1 Uncharacterised protein [Mycobacteroides abscessus subsp. massiliense]SKL27927.1 Uncharacterised protein [Mycobacteroides abscessus subsp. massiliense]SKM32203.1 Uncharacterised protein [Mycobacteroides abscessus subsp. massiliense]SKQ80476.1 Uncharacterised protein [Mycobacteroides abscessus subsp. massiliense]
MSTDGIEAVFLTTHNWGRAARFYQALGYELDFETDHNSGQLRNKTGPYLFIAEIPESEPTATQQQHNWSSGCQMPTRSSPTLSSML